MTEFFPGDDDGQDAFLRKALLLANSPQVMGLSDASDAIPPRLAHRMARLLADPFRRARQSLRPRWNRALRTAAGFLVVLSLGLFTAMLHPSAGAWIDRMVVEWKTHGVDFVFQGTPLGELGQWAPGYLPEGYAPAVEEEWMGTQAVTYQKEGEADISFEYMLIQQGTVLGIDREHSDHEQISIHGRLADLFRSNTPGYPSYLIWTDEEETTAFCLMSEIDPDELVRMGRSVVKSKIP